MQRMRPHIPPKPIQPNLLPRRPRSSNLEDARRNPQPDVRRDDLDARHPLRKLATSTRANVPFLAVLGVDVGSFLPGSVGEGLGGAEVRFEVAVPFQDVEFVGDVILVVAAKGPCAAVLARVGGCELQGAEGDAEVEVGEDELDSFPGSLLDEGKGEREQGLEVRERTCVGKRSAAKGILRRDSMGFLASGSHPKASVQGALTSEILTLPDSVRRSPRLSQLCFSMSAVIQE